MPLSFNIMMPFGYSGGKSIVANRIKGSTGPVQWRVEPVPDDHGRQRLAGDRLRGDQFFGTGHQLRRPLRRGELHESIGHRPGSSNRRHDGNGWRHHRGRRGQITAIATNTAGSGYGGSSIDGKPIAINATKDAGNVSTGGKPGANAPVASAVSGGTEMGGSGASQTPDLAGTWTYVADESNPSAPMTIRLYSQTMNTFFFAGDTHGSTYTPGPNVGGVLVGSMWQFNVVRSPSTQGWLALFLDVISGTSGSSQPWTHSNEFLTAPLERAAGRGGGDPGSYRESMAAGPGTWWPG